MASTMITSGSRATSARNKRRKKVNQISQNQIPNEQKSSVAWKSEVQQQVYSSKLLHALRQLRLDSAPKRGRAVREAADRVLAVAARGRTRWSRAILTTRLKLKFMKKSSNKRLLRASTLVTGNTQYSRLQKKGRAGILRLKAKNLPAVQRKVKVLGRLVPGCRKQPMPVVLEEASDYKFNH
ncbi:hypothetical protein Leryth_021593, partial [Lithospermum erythrorhizon]